MRDHALYSRVIRRRVSTSGNNARVSTLETQAMYTLTDVSPYQVSCAMRVSRDEAREMLADTSGSTYERDVFGTHYTLDPVARTLTATYGETADDTPADTGHAYTFYVGSTSQHGAHDEDDAWTLRAIVGQGDAPDYIWGVWDGEVEATAAYQLRLADDATAQRIAYALAILTGNDCVMVTRDLARGEGDRAMASVRPFIVSQESRVAFGNRTLYTSPYRNSGAPDFVDEISPGLGYRFVPDVKGDEIAYLVWADASVSAVSA
jgi:hypothetical protein